MRLKPCFRCRLQNKCEEKARRQASVRGLNLRMIDFVCAEKRDDLCPGMVCIATLPFTWDRTSFTRDDGAPDVNPGQVRVVVRRWQERRVVVAAFADQAVSMISKSNEAITNAKLYPDLLTPTGEVIAVQSCCGWPMGWGPDNQPHCYACNDMHAGNAGY